MKVRAYAAQEPSAQLAPWTFEMDRPGPTECIVTVRACGLCRSDVSMLGNDWGITTYPFVPGHEIVGEVAEIGDQVHHMKKGDRVGVGWQGGACLQCDDCLKGKENLCSQTRPTIVGHHGGFAEAVKVDSRFAFPLPKGMDTNDAGPLLCGGITVYSALRHAGMKGAQRVGIIGVGGLGHLAVQFAARLGNEVTVFTTTPQKAEYASQLGAHHAVVTREGLPRDVPAQDILLNTVHVPLDWNAYVNLLASDGTLAFVGAPAEPLNVPVASLLMKRRRIMASPIGSRAEIVEMLQAADTFGVRPTVETFPLAEINGAIARLRANQIRYRAVVTL